MGRNFVRRAIPAMRRTRFVEQLLKEMAVWHFGAMAGAGKGA